MVPLMLMAWVLLEVLPVRSPNAARGWFGIKGLGVWRREIVLVHEMQTAGESLDPHDPYHGH